MAAELLPTHTAALFNTAVQRAAELLRAGEVVALPTETVYGLAANALDAQAVAKIFEIKGRPAHNPIIVHVASLAMAKRCTSHWSATAERLAAAFWPGPLTVVLPRADIIPDNVTAGGATAGIRWPSHPFIQAVIRACDFPLAAPSANVSNHISPTNAEHVRKHLGAKLPLIVDGGQSQVGIESTVLDLTGGAARVLRPGIIHEESLAAAGVSLANPSADHTPDTAALKSPGLLKKHYSPKARLIVLRWRDTAEFASQVRASGVAAEDCHVITHSHLPSGVKVASISVIPHDAEAYARALYAELHRCDEAGAKFIVAEALPETPEWRGAADRLRRAAS